jgi:hypothetical protein
MSEYYELWTRKTDNRSPHSLCQDTLPTFNLRTEKDQVKTLAIIAGVLAKILVSQSPYTFNELLVKFYKRLYPFISSFVSYKLTMMRSPRIIYACISKFSPMHTNNIPSCQIALKIQCALKLQGEDCAQKTWKIWEDGHCQCSQVKPNISRIKDMTISSSWPDGLKLSFQHFWTRPIVKIYMR